MRKCFLMLAFAAMIALVSCGNGIRETGEESSDGGTYLVIGSASVARTIKPDEGAANVGLLSSLELKGTRAGDEEITLTTAESYASLTTGDDENVKKIPIQTGNWSFILTAKLGDIDFSGTTTATIKTGTTNTISFELSANEPYGGMYIYLKIQEGGEDLTKITATLKTADESETLDEKIYEETDENGNDVTDQFAVKTESGTLTVTRRQVLLSSVSLSKQYDGRSLTSAALENSGIQILLDGFADGEGVLITLDGKQTLPGQSANSFRYVFSEGTLEENYAVTTQFGTLTVSDRDVDDLYEITLSLTAADAVYNGETQTVSGLDQSEFIINGSKYTVSGIEGYAEGVHAGNYPVSYQGNTIVRDEEGNDVTSQFRIHTQPVSWVIQPRSIEFRSASAEKEYDGEILSAKLVQVFGDGFVGNDTADFTISGSQLLPGSSDNVFTYTLSEETRPSDYQISVVYGTLKVVDREVKYELNLHAADGEFTYDGESHTYSGLSDLSFTQSGKKYTLSGVSASVTAKDAGNYPVVIEGVPRIYDATGNDVTMQFEVHLYSGTLTVRQRSVVIESDSAEKEYDGSPLTALTYRISGDGFVKEEGVSVVFQGSQTVVGASENAFIYEAEDGTDLNNYKISVVYGMLNVLSRFSKYTIDLYAESVSSVYNGFVQKADRILQNRFEIEGHTYTVTGVSAYGEGKDAGSYPIILSGTAVVLDENGEDVSSEFSVRMHSGELTIEKRKVTFSSISACKTYDGDPLTTADLPDLGISVSGDGFVMQEGVRFTLTGSRTLSGVSKNTFRYEAMGSTNLDNYEITEEYGELRVISRSAETKYPVTVSVRSVSVIYDGNEHTVSELDGLSVLVDGHTYTVTGLSVERTERNAGEYPVEISGEAVVLDHEGNDVTEEFSLRKESGTLVIHRRNVLLTSASAEKEYDGKPLTVNSVSVSQDGFAYGEGAITDVTGTQTLVGSSYNTFTYSLQPNTLAHNYNITKEEGILSVVNRGARYEIQLETNSLRTRYDGEEKSVSGFRTLQFEFEGSVYTVGGIMAEVSAVHAGEYPLAISSEAVVYDENGNDVTSQFAVSLNVGSLIIEKRQLTLISASDEKEYDGSPLTRHEVFVGGDGFAQGEGAQYDIYGEQLIAGSSDNYFSYTLNDNTDAKDYEITQQNGRLTVNRREKSYEITLQANSGSVLYDGNEHTVSGFETLRFQLNGSTYTVSGLEASATGLQAGTYEVKAEGQATVRDSRGNDVTSEFIVHTQSGELTIQKRKVVLISADAEKEYDGTALKAETISVSGDGFAGSDGADVVYDGAQTLPGSSPNTFRYTLWDSVDADNYEISCQYGSLQVKQRDSRYEVSLYAVGKEVLYNGEEQNVSGFETLLFKENGVSFIAEGISSLAEGRDAGRYETVIEGTPVIRDMNGNDVTSQFIVHLIPSALTIRPREVIITSLNAEKEYDGIALTREEVSYQGDGFVKEEGVSVLFEGSRTLVGSAENVFRYEWKDNTSAGNYHVTVKYGLLNVFTRSSLYEVEVVAVSDSFVYDGEEHSVSGIVDDTFLINGSLYTVSNLTAQSSAVDAGVYTVSVTGEAIVRDQYGNDVTSQFAVRTKSGTLTIEKRSVVLVSASDQKEYDGTPLRNTEVSVEGDGFAKNEGAATQVTSSRTLPGSEENRFTYRLDPDTKAENYDITTVYGTLRVLSREEKYEITVIANSEEVLYDGQPHTLGGLQTSEFVINGNTYTLSGLTAEASGTDAGSYPVKIEGSAVITDSQGNDVTSQFQVNTEEGNLLIQKRKVSLISASSQKEYDGTALTSHEISVGKDGFAANEGAEYAFSGSQLTVGESANRFSYVLNEGTKADNYIITKEEGKLTVTARRDPFSITLKASEGEVLYDGNSHTVSGFETLDFVFEDVRFTVEGVSASVTAVNAGFYAVNITGTAIVRDAYGNDVTDQFDISRESGSLQILKRSVRIRSFSDEKEFDGSVLKAEEVEISGDGFAADESVDIFYQGAQYTVGSSLNSFTYADNGTADLKNYEIETEFGTLTVTHREQPYEIELQTNTAEYLYDGTQKEVSGFVTAEAVVGGHHYYVSGSEAYVSATDAGTYQLTLSGEAHVYDADGNDVTSEFTVTTEVRDLTVRPRSVRIVSLDRTKEYDGTALEYHEVRVEGDGFAANEGAEYLFSGSQLTTGSSENIFRYQLLENTKADNYVIETANGVLEVTDRYLPYEIVLNTVSGSVLYDGNTHTLEGFESLQWEENGSIYTVDGLRAYAEGTDAGSYLLKSEGEARVLDAFGNDVTKQFNVTVNEHALTVQPRRVTITSASQEKTYDGTILQAPSASESADGFVRGEGALYDFTGGQLLPGSSQNIFTYILNENTKAENYRITLAYGTLKVTDRSVPYEIHVKALSDKVTYDGSEHVLSGFETLEFEVEGQKYTLSGLSAEAKGTDAGVYPVTISGEALVRDSAGNDVTSQFAIDKENGTLRVTARKVTLRSASADKVYDGYALQDKRVNVEGDGFVRGEGATYDVTGSRTLRGSAENSFTYALNANTKAENYEITTVFGTLRVDPREAKYEISVEARGAQTKYDGSAQSISGFETLTYEIEGNTYTVEGLSSYAEGKDAGSYTTLISGEAIVKDAAGNDVSDEFIVKTTGSELVIAPRSVILQSGSAEKEYDGSALTSQEISVNGDGFATGEGAEYAFSGRQLIAGSSENSFTYTLNENTKAGNYEIAVRYGTLVVTDRSVRYEITLKANSDTVKYDGKDHSVSGFETLQFEVEGNSYTVEGLSSYAEGKDAGSYATLISGEAIVKDAAGNDVTRQFALQRISGELKITKREVELISSSAEKEYDGTALIRHEVSVEKDGFVKGEEPVYIYEGTQTLAGISENRFRYQLKDGVKESNYEITVRYGTLNVRQREALYEIEVTAKSLEVKYDGESHRISGFETLEFEVEGNRYTVEGLKAEAEGRDAGVKDVNITGTGRVLDAEGNDVSEQFSIRTVNGTLRIDQREVVLISGSAKKEYDGSALTSHEVSVEGDGFAANEGAEYLFSGSRTLKGESENLFSYALNENTKEQNYRITVRYGTLEVTDRSVRYEITLKAKSDTVKYDGESHSISGFETLSVTINGHSYRVEGIHAEAEGKHAGSYQVIIQGTPVVMDENGNDVTEQFKVNLISGELKVEKREVILTSASGEKQYDGSALRDSTVSVSADGFATGEGAAYEVSGSQTLVGSSANTFTYRFNDNTDADDYTIRKVEGVLTVISRSVLYDITLEANSLEVLYDGEEHEVSGFRTLQFERNGHIFLVEGIDAYAAAVHAGEYPLQIDNHAAIYDEEHNDVTSQFAVHVINGTLRINQREVVLSSGSAEKEYDGSPLTSSEITVSADGFASGEGASYEVSGEQTLVGFAENSFTYTLDENTLAFDYRIRQVYGLLKVLNRNARYEIEVQAKSATFLYDGEEKQVNELVSTRFGINDQIYTVEGLQADTHAVHAGKYEVHVVGNPTVYDASGNDVSEQFVVTARSGLLEIQPREVVLQSANATKIYDGKPLFNHEVEIGRDGFVRSDGVSIQMSGIRTTPGTAENSFDYRLNEGTLADDYQIQTVYGLLSVLNRPEDARYEVTLIAESAEVLYDGQSHTIEEIALINGSEPNKTEEGYLIEIDGVSYLLRGVQAYAEGKDAGIYSCVISGDPYITDEEGNDVTSQFIIAVQPGQLEIQQRKIVMTSGSATHAYTGKTLTNSEVTLSGDNFADGEGASYEVSGYRTLVGVSENTFSYQLNENTLEKNYQITKVYGKLVVTNRDARYEITLTPNSAEALYDGEEKSVEGFETMSFEMNGVSYTVSGITASVSAVDAGVYPVSISGAAVVSDAEGNDVTNQFSVLVNSGQLTVRPRQLTLTSADLSKQYDGTPLEGEGVIVSGDGFVAGEGASYLMSGSRTLPGVSSNSFTYLLDSNTKAENYEIETVFGLLSVTDRSARYEIVLQANSGSFRYDGQVHEVSGFETTEFEIDGHIYHVEGVEASASAVEPGIYTLTIRNQAIVRDESGNDVTDQFAITVLHGTLQIRALYQLTVRYLNENRMPVAGSYIGYYEAGEMYGPIAVPTVAGYQAPYRWIVSSEAGMPAQDMVITVIYTEQKDGTVEPEESPRAVVEANADDEEIIVEVIEDVEMPLANVTKAYWALINLLLTIVGTLLSILLMIHYLKERREQKEKEEESNQLESREAERSEDSEEEQDEKKKRTVRILSVLWFIVSVVIFVLTEDLTNTMCLVDRWTLVMVVCFLAHLFITYRSLRNDEDEEEEEDSQMQGAGV